MELLSQIVHGYTPVVDENITALYPLCCALEIQIRYAVQPVFKLELIQSQGMI